VSQDGKFLRGGIGMADDGGVMRIHPNAELLPVFYGHPDTFGGIGPIAN
jgi:hypothetical protein